LAIPIGASAAAAMLAAAGCTASSDPHVGTTETVIGTVSGTFLREGGPIGPGGQQPKEVKLAGQIEFLSSGRLAAKAEVGKTGRFSVGLTPGRYTVSGRSPQIVEVTANGKDRERPCSQPASVTVRPGRTVKITVICAVP
jgi:hypothetical protein